ncbi:MAG: hypothetical protein AB7F32_09800 [Victivallaceae bacterium]
MMKWTLTAAALVAATLLRADAPQLEALGEPVRCGEIKIAGVSRVGDKVTAWAPIRLPERRGLAGIDIATGKVTWIDLDKYNPTSLSARVKDGKAYVMPRGKEGMVIEYDIASGKVSEYKMPIAATYFLDTSADFAPDGKLYLGGYPETQIGWFDPQTGKTGGTPRISPDPRQKYILFLLAAKDNCIYFTVGLHHPEIWSFNPATGDKKQLLPAKYLESADKPRIALGRDGAVYAKVGSATFKCFPDRLEEVSDWPVDPQPDNRMPGFATDVKLDADRVAIAIDNDGSLIVRNLATQKDERLKTGFEPFFPLVYSVCGGLDGRIWVGSFTPAALASFDGKAAKPEFTNYGKVSSGSTQIYWTLEFPDRVYTSSYVGAALDRMDKKTGESKLVFKLGAQQQERLFMLVPGPGGKYYGPTMPIKGHLGGGIVEFDPATEKYSFERNVIAEQSLRALAPADGGLLFGVSDINGGTSAIPSEKTAKVFLYDPATKKAVWSIEPIKTEKTYLGAYPLGKNRFWTIAQDSRKVVVIDAAARKVEKIIDLPRGTGIRPVGSTAALGNRAIVLSGDSLLDVDADSGKVTTVLKSPIILEKFAKALHGTHAEYLAPDGTVYFGSNSGLYRVKLK